MTTEEEATGDDLDEGTTDEVDPWDGGQIESEEFIQVRFVEVLVPLPATNPVVVLEEMLPPGRELRITIALADGVAIAYGAREIATPKPLTHELMTVLLESFGLSLEVVRITDAQGGAFAAEIVVSGPAGPRTIPCRTSDALALALRQRLFVPIVAAARVLEEVGTLPDEDGDGV